MASEPLRAPRAAAQGGLRGQDSRDPGVCVSLASFVFLLLIFSFFIFSVFFFYANILTVSIF